MSDDGLKAEAAGLGREIAARQGRLSVIAGEMERRRSWDDDGASSLAAWLVERNGISESAGRVIAGVGERLVDLPHLAQAFEAGELGLDKVAAVIGFAEPESDAEVTQQAKESSVKELHQLARYRRGVRPGDDEAQRSGRYMRFNDTNGTISGKLAKEGYALVKNSIDEAVKAMGSDGETPLDQRRADALIRICRDKGTVGGAGPPSSGAGRHLVVLHIDFADFKSSESTASAELERFGLISAAVARRIACGADVALAFDDEMGHTMYEGRAQRFATPTQRREVWRRDRSCRFPRHPYPAKRGVAPGPILSVPGLWAHQFHPGAPHHRV
jgi:hypothetical protein